LRKGYLKILAACVAVIMLSGVSVGDVPEVFEELVTIEPISSVIPSAIVWSEEFEDGDISDWEIFEINWTLPDGVANFSVDSLDLVNVSDGVMQLIGPEWIFAAYNSSIAYGTWTFDVDIQQPEGFNRFGVNFIGERFGEHWLPPGGSSRAYFLSFWCDEQEIRFALNDYPSTTVFLDSHRPAVFFGWNSFIVTRDPTGQFYVYLNGELILDVEDSTHTTSEQFGIFGMANPAIDNITGSDTIDYDAAPPKWDQVPTDHSIDYGTDFSYDLNATDYAGIDQWWINNTDYFTIDNDGVISNIDVLGAGSYVINVSVNDTLGNTQTETFRLTVGDPPSLIPIELIIGSAGIIVFGIIVLEIWRRKR
jgi:hypothetical protein